MSASEKIDAMHDRGVECLETFRNGFLAAARGQYRLTLIARNEAFPDGSRDLIITSDQAEGMRAAIDRRFPPDGPSPSGAAIGGAA